MISVDFAPNEKKSDAFVALKILFQPWIWRKGSALSRIKRRLKSLFFPNDASLFLFFSGRGALYHLLKSFDLPQGSQVIVQGFTCEAVVLPILAVKCEPIYVDITEEDFSLSIDDLKKKYTDKCKVLILQHTFGICPKNRAEILAFAVEKNLIVIEDIAHGFDPSLFKNHISTILLMSFGRSKSFSSVFGGAVVTTQKSLSTKLTDLEETLPGVSWMTIMRILIYKPLAWLIKSTYSLYIGKLIHGISRHLHILIPEITKEEKAGKYNTLFSSAFPNAAAILLLEQFRTWNDTIRRRRSTTKMYAKAFANPYASDALSRFPLNVPYKFSTITQAQKSHMYLGKWYDQPVAPSPLALDKVKYVPGSCPVAEEMCKRIINLPTLISDREAQTVIDICKID